LVETSNGSDKAIRMEIFSEDDTAVIFPAPNPALPTLPSLGGNPLRFVSGEAVAPRAMPVEKPRAHARRRPCLDLFDMAVMVLIIACGTICIYRIFWAMQP